MGLSIIKKHYGANHFHAAKFYNGIGIALPDKGTNDTILQIYHMALAILKNHYGMYHPDIARIYNNIAYGNVMVRKSKA